MAQRGRSGGGQAVHVVGLKEFRAELKRLDNPREWSRELGRVQREVAKNVARWAQGEAQGFGRSPQAHFASAIVGRGGPAGARIGLRTPAANAAFWGAKQRSGWNAGNDAPNLPEWVGNGWDVGGPGGPYAINAAVRDRMDEIVRDYREAMGDLVSRAFPD